MEENNNAWPLLDINYPDKAHESSSIIKVVGVGGGGGNAVANMYKEGIQEVTYLIINTDKKALDASIVPNRLLIGDGLGAGAKPEKAEKDALDGEEAIRAALNDGTKMVFITAGMGGGTGTGASPIVARVSRELGILTIGIVTIPFDFEGFRKIQMALRGVAAIRQHVDALLIVNNTRLAEIYPDLNFFNAFKKADDTLTTAAKSISDIINKTGYINLDFADVMRTLENSGVALISTGQGSGENRLATAIQNAITSPLLQDNEITSAQRLLFEVCFSEENPMTMSESKELNEFTSRMNPDIEVIWGAMVDNSLGEDIRIIVLAAGFDLDNNTGRISSHSAEAQRVSPQPAPQQAPVEVIAAPTPAPAEQSQPAVTEQPQTTAAVAQAPVNKPVPSAPTPAPAPTPTPAPPTIVETPTAQPVSTEATEATTAPAPIVDTPETTVPPTMAPTADPTPASAPVSSAPTASAPVASAPTSTPAPTPAAPTVTPTQDPLQSIDEIRRYYGEETADGMRMDQIRKNYYLLDNDDLTNEELVAMLERMPAYNRTIEQLGELKKVSAQAKEQNPTPAAPNNGFIF